MKFSSTPKEGVSLVFSSIKGSSWFSDGQSAVACGSLSLDPLQTACCSIDRSLEWHDDLCHLYILTARVTKSSRSSCTSPNNLVFVPILYCLVILYVISLSLIVLAYIFKRRSTLYWCPKRGSDWFTAHTLARTHTKNTCTCSHCWRCVRMSNRKQPFFNFFGRQLELRPAAAAPMPAWSLSHLHSTITVAAEYFSRELIQIKTAGETPHNGWRYLHGSTGLGT